MKPQAKVNAKKAQAGSSKKPPVKASDIKASSVKSLGINLGNHNETLLVA